MSHFNTFEENIYYSCLVFCSSFIWIYFLITLCLTTIRFFFVLLRRPVTLIHFLAVGPLEGFETCWILAIRLVGELFLFFNELFKLLFILLIFVFYAYLNIVQMQLGGLHPSIHPSIQLFQPTVNNIPQKQLSLTRLTQI